MAVANFSIPIDKKSIHFFIFIIFTVVFHCLCAKISNYSILNLSIQNFSYEIKPKILADDHEKKVRKE